MYSPLPIRNLGSLELYFWTLDLEIQINVWCFFGHDNFTLAERLSIQGV